AGILLACRLHLVAASAEGNAEAVLDRVIARGLWDCLPDPNRREPLHDRPALPRILDNHAVRGEFPERRLREIRPLAPMDRDHGLVAPGDLTESLERTGKEPDLGVGLHGDPVPDRPRQARGAGTAGSHRIAHELDDATLRIPERNGHA